MISSVVVDTDVLSFVFKGDSREALYRPHLFGRVAIISFMTIAELRQWTLVKNWGSVRQQELERFLQQFLTFHSNDSLCNMWALVAHRAFRDGSPIDNADAWIAATALLHNIPLVTHNKRHFMGVVGLTVISETAPCLGNPWNACEI